MKPDARLRERVKIAELEIAGLRRGLRWLFAIVAALALLLALAICF